MASFTKFLPIFILLSLFSPLPIQSRESKFFSKFNTQFTTKETNTPTIDVDVLTPSTAPAPAPAPEPESGFESGNGYGLYGQEVNEYPFENKPTTTPTTTFEGEIPTEELTEESFTTGVTTSYDRDNGYNNNNNYYYNGYEGERQGMSDTRYMENGKYRYDVKNENVYTNGNQNSYGNKQNSYEFDTMEEYEEYEKQHGYNQNQDTYMP